MLQTPSFSDILGFTKVLPLQRSYNWDVFLPFSFGGIPGELVGRYCQAVQFGEYNINEVSSMKYGAFRSFYAGLLEIDKVSMIFVKPVPDVVSLFFRAWKESIIDSQGYYNPKSAYKKNIYVLLEDSTMIPFDRIILKGLFPTIFPAYDISYESEDIVQFTITFSVDRVEYDSVADSLRRLVKGVIPRIGDIAGVGGGGIKDTIVGAVTKGLFG